MKTYNTSKTTYSSTAKCLLLLSMLSCFVLVQASEKAPSQLSEEENTPTKLEQTMDDHFNIDFHFKNMHTWHGSVVTPGVMLATSMEFKTKNEAFVLGLWGGSSFDGQYKEFSYYTSYRFNPHFKVNLISHNNYSNSENPNIFSYDKFTSPNFVDIVFEYTVSEKVPLDLYWSTILLGNGGDYETNADGSVTDSYSTYVQMSYDVYSKGQTTVNIFAGGAFAFATEKTFYSEKANIINLGLTVEQKVSLFSHTIPVSATGFWNPETKVGALQLDITLF